MIMQADVSIANRPPRAVSWYEASARQRLLHFLDAGSFVEFLGPEQREISPHLKAFNLPEQFDDGMIVGRGFVDGERAFVAAQEGRFMGGAIGEVHGAKLTGLLRAAAALKNVPVFIFFDTGGVRLQEANAGEIAIAEIMRAVIEARMAGVKVIGVIGGRSGCYGGGSLIAGCCSGLVISEQGRISVSGPEVIETNRGVEEFDSKDRALVWRTMGGKHRMLIDGADAYAEDSIDSFRQAVLDLMRSLASYGKTSLHNEQARLEDRLKQFGTCKDALDIWKLLNVEDPKAVPGMRDTDFIELAYRAREVSHEAR